MRRGGGELKLGSRSRPLDAWDFELDSEEWENKYLQSSLVFRPLEYERVYLPLYQVADTPFHIQGDDLAKMQLTQKPREYITRI